MNTIIPLKYCPQCNQDKPLTAFGIDRSKSDGLDYRCRECKRAYNRKRYIKKERPIVPEGHKRCTKCHQNFPATNEFFHHTHIVKDGLTSACKVCRNAVSGRYKTAHLEQEKARNRAYETANREKRRLKNRTYYAKNREQETARSRTYQQEHAETVNPRKYKYTATHAEQFATYARNRRMRLINLGTHTQEDIQDQLKRQRGKCYYCSAKLGKGKRAYHVDHVVPITRNGTNDKWNLVIACPHCNVSKHNKLLHEWPKGGRLL